MPIPEEELQKLVDDLFRQLAINEPQLQNSQRPSENTISKTELLACLQTLDGLRNVISSKVQLFDETDKGLELTQGPFQIRIEEVEREPVDVEGNPLPDDGWVYSMIRDLHYQIVNVIRDGTKKEIFKTTKEVIEIGHLALSPDTRRLAFDAYHNMERKFSINDTGNNLMVNRNYSSVYVMGIDGTNLSQITDENCTETGIDLRFKSYGFSFKSYLKPSWIDNETLSFLERVTTKEKSVLQKYDVGIKEYAYRAKLDAANKIVGEMRKA